ncbi:O-methyltransferase [Arthrobacter sp. H14]|uniref:O-methyltransferase n=1 Tax=Arthrobacter sp. H14 TaxID=1312959 RepID=UPI00047D6AAA|nr:O-methyltransferase [Arthrobacter sp. H14]
MKDQWNDVDEYLKRTVVGPDDALEQAVRATADAGMPAIEVTAAQGKLLMLLAQIQGARKVLEIGTLGGFSTIWMARGIPGDGRIVSCEFEPRHAEVALANLERAGLSDKVDIRVGAALDTLPTLAGEAPFDLFFIDADKANNPNYLEWAVKLSRPGSVIVLDNVVRGGSIRDGAVAEDASETGGAAGGAGAGSVEDEDIRGTREALELLGSHPRLDATAIQTVGAKGWDGFAIAVVR